MLICLCFHFPVSKDMTMEINNTCSSLQDCFDTVYLQIPSTPGSRWPQVNQNPHIASTAHQYPWPQQKKSQVILCLTIRAAAIENPPAPVPCMHWSLYPTLLKPNVLIMPILEHAYSNTLRFNTPHHSHSLLIHAHNKHHQA